MIGKKDNKYLLNVVFSALSFVYDISLSVSYSIEGPLGIVTFYKHIDIFFVVLIFNKNNTEI